MGLHTVDTLDPQPFKHACTTIGEIPSSFTESMSYYEMLAWFSNYLTTTIIAAINDNANILQELDDFIYNLNLHDYVDQVLREYIESGTFYQMLTYDATDESLTLTFDIRS